MPSTTQQPGLPLYFFMLISSLGAFTSTLILPALPLMADELAASKNVIQLSLSLYLMTMGLGQLIAGPLADHYGTKPVLLTGVCLHISGCLFAAIAPSVEWLLVGRTLQALGSSAGLILARVLIFEQHGDKSAGGKIAYLSLGIAVAQAIGPFIGGHLSMMVGWRSSLIIPMLVSASAGLIAFIRIPAKTRSPGAAISFRATLKSFKHLLQIPDYVKYSLSSSCVAAGYFLFLGAAPYIVVNQLTGNAADFGTWFVLVALGFMAGSFISARISAKLGKRRMVYAGLSLSGIGAIVILCSQLTGALSYLSLFIPFALYTFGRGWSQPNNQAAAIAATTVNRGSASGLLGFIQVICGSLAAQLAPTIMAYGLIWIFIGILALLTLSLGFISSTEK